GGGLMGKTQGRVRGAREPRCPFDLVPSVEVLVVMRGSLCQRRQARWLCWVAARGENTRRNQGRCQSARSCRQRCGKSLRVKKGCPVPDKWLRNLVHPK